VRRGVRRLRLPPASQLANRHACSRSDVSALETLVGVSRPPCREGPPSLEDDWDTARCSPSRDSIPAGCRPAMRPACPRATGAAVKKSLRSA